MARCSRVKLEDSTPPYSSASLTVPSADLAAVFYGGRENVISEKKAPKSFFMKREYLKSEVLEDIRKASLGLVPAASFDEEGYRRSRLAVVDCSDFYTCSIDCGCKIPETPPSSPCSCSCGQHR